MASRLVPAVCLVASFALLLAASIPCASSGGISVTIKLSSPNFPAAGKIPKEYTCDGADRSPQLTWTQPPAGTESLALIADDPDAPVGTWVHWVIYDLPAGTISLPQGVAKTEHLADGSKQGENDFRKIGYRGPCPPAGKAHRYFFRLYALDKKLGLAAGATTLEVERAMQGHIVAQAELMGLYGR